MPSIGLIAALKFLFLFYSLVEGQPVLLGMNLTWANELPRINQYFTCTAEFDNPLGTTTVYFWFYMQSIDTGNSVIVSPGPATSVNSRSYYVTTPYHKGDMIHCTGQLTDSNGLVSSVGSSDSTILVNSPPVISGMSLTPTNGGTLDPITCAVTRATDVDDTGPFSYSYYWTVSGSLATGTGSSTSVLGEINFVKGQIVVCYATPSDGTDAGSPTSCGLSVTIADTAAYVTNVRIQSSTSLIQTGSSLTCAYDGPFDPDPVDTVFTVEVIWYVNGVSVLTIPTAPYELGEVYIQSRDVVYCTARAFDGYLPGTPALSSQVTVNNTPPVVEADIVPSSSSASLDAATDVRCSATRTTDADNDTTFRYSYRLIVNGVTLSTSSLTSASSYTFSHNNYRKDNIVACAVAATDYANVLGEYTLSTSLTVVNLPPTLSEVTLSPDDIANPSQLACVAGTFFDFDGDALQTTYYYWYRNDVSMGLSTSTSSITSNYWGLNDVLKCAVVLSDGFDNSLAINSNLIRISAPFIITVRIM
jgi:hypothetical protein